MSKKKISYILFFLIVISLVIIFYGIYTIYSYDRKVEEISISVEKVIDNKIEINEEVNDDSLKDAIGLIIFQNNKKISIFNNPSDYYLKIGVGKIVNNSVLNEYGNNILLGHRDSSFSVLKNLEVNDTFEIKTKDSTINYKITDIYITTKEDPIPYQDSDDLKITLITCYPFVYVGNAPQRYVVIAKAI